jgi:hypothetical protein
MDLTERDGFFLIMQKQFQHSNRQEARCLNLDEGLIGKIEKTAQNDDKTMAYSTKCGFFRIS